MRRAEAVIAAAILAGSAALIFTHLGHYAFWNDEAYTALLAKSVWRTGDTHAVLGHNVIAFQGGAALENLRHRFDPPLAYYVAAPFLGLLGDHALAGRLPFALCGLATIALMVRWAWRERASRLTWLVLAIAVLGNVSLMLYSRQCRYYSLAMLCSTALAYLYLHWNGSRRGLAAMAAVSVCLLATNYINYAAFYACAAVDYLAWGRMRRRFSRRDLLLLFAPQLILGALIVSVWNPLGKAVVPHESASWLADKATLLWWNLRDLNRCEFGVGLLLLAAPLLYLAGRLGWPARRATVSQPPSLSGRGKGEGGTTVRPSPCPLPGRERGCGTQGDLWLLRGFAALLAYVVAATLLSPQPVGVTDAADVRYLVPLIPLCVILGVRSLRTLTRRLPAAADLLAIVAFGTNLLHGAPLWGDPPRSTIAEYVGELAHPRETAYGAAAAWVNDYVADGASVWVLPEYAVSPLMFHAPKAVYAWQLSDPPHEQFRGLPDIHFKDRVPPDYIIAFGPVVGPLRKVLEGWRQKGLRYYTAETLPNYWRDTTRPELFWHAFRPVETFDSGAEGVHIFRRAAQLPAQP
ncbi:MAG TPA: hypothetical protein VNE39_19065 [Planctomycetota bacterium]|nr:hypothetical protein [Planctomycetota bacterium]